MGTQAGIELVVPNFVNLRRAVILPVGVHGGQGHGAASLISYQVLARKIGEENRPTAKWPPAMALAINPISRDKIIFSGQTPVLFFKHKQHHPLHTAPIHSAPHSRLLLAL
jgi:hypothetical protein